MPTDQTATVTEIRPPLVHYESCDRDVFGRAVMFYLDRGTPGDQITISSLRHYAEGWRATQPCDCLSLRIKSTVGQLERANKAWEACTSDDNADRVTFLKATLSRLRGMQ